MDRAALSANLKRLRVYQNQTQVKLAEKAGISVQAYRNLEAGRSKPRVRTLNALADALGVGVGALLAPPKRLHAVRFRARKKLRMRDHVLVEVGRWLDDFNELEKVFDEGSPAELPHMDPHRPMEAAREVRDRFGPSPREAIQDACGLFEENGIKVFTIPVASNAFFGLSVAAEGGGPAVVVNVWQRISVERWIFTAAHELGHLVLHRDAFDVEKTEEDPNEEKEANIFGSYFLMPREAFLQKWRDSAGMRLVDRVLWVKRLFGVSYQTVLYRLHELGWKANVWASFYYEYQRDYGKKLSRAEEPQGLPPESFLVPEPRKAQEPQRLADVDFEERGLRRLVRRALLEGEISMGRAAEILRIDRVSIRELAASWVAEKEQVLE